jgi:hypothetical protein
LDFLRKKCIVYNSLFFLHHQVCVFILLQIHVLKIKWIKIN